MNLPAAETAGKFIVPEALPPSTSFDFNMILSYALMQFSKVLSYSDATQELHHSMNKVLLQKTFQPAAPPEHAVSGLMGT